MQTDEIEKQLNARINSQQMTLERVWTQRLNAAAEGLTGVNAVKLAQNLSTIFMVEAESRYKDVMSLIVLNLKGSDLGMHLAAIDASAAVLTTHMIKINDSIRVRYREMLIKKTGPSLEGNVYNVPASYIQAKHEMALVWLGFEIKNNAVEIIKERSLLDATLQSAKASTEAAGAEQLSANASVIAATAARTTAVWTRWAVVATAVAAISTAVSAYYTMRSAGAPQKESPAQVVDQNIANDAPVIVPKTK